MYLQFFFFIVTLSLIGSSLSTSSTSSSLSSSSPIQSTIVKDDDDEVIPFKDSKLLQKKMFNFASNTAGAVILDKSPSNEKGFKNLLNDDKDKYGICPCEEKKWIVIGLSEDILISSIVLANYERYSSTIKEFQLLGSTSYPTNDWIDLGVYQAEPKLGEQTFNILNNEDKIKNEGIHTRYLKLKWISHYLDESLCTLSQIKVFGVTVLASLKEEVDLNAGTNRYSNMLLNDFEANIVDTTVEGISEVIVEEVLHLQEQILNDNKEIVSEKLSVTDETEVENQLKYELLEENISNMEENFVNETSEVTSSIVSPENQDEKDDTQTVKSGEHSQVIEIIEESKLIEEEFSNNLNSNINEFNNEVSYIKINPEEFSDVINESNIQINENSNKDESEQTLKLVEEVVDSVQIVNAEQEFVQPIEIEKTQEAVSTSNSTTPLTSTSSLSSPSSLSPNCLESIKFNEFRSKMLIKLNSLGSTSSSSDSGESTSSSNDNVFKQLFQKVKQLEIDQAISERYLIHLTECLKVTDKNIQYNLSEFNLIKDNFKVSSNSFFTISYEEIFNDNELNINERVENGWIINYLIKLKYFVLQSTESLENTISQLINFFDTIIISIKNEREPTKIENYLNRMIEFQMSIFVDYCIPLFKFNTKIFNYFINFSIFLFRKTENFSDYLYSLFTQSQLYSYLNLKYSEFYINNPKDIIKEYNLNNNQLIITQLFEKVKSLYNYVIDYNTNILNAHSRNFIIQELISSYNNSLIETSSYNSKSITKLRSYIGVIELKNKDEIKKSLLEMNLSLMKNQLDFLPTFLLSYYYQIHLFVLENKKYGNNFNNYLIIGVLLVSILVLIILQFQLMKKLYRKLSIRVFP